MEAKFQRYNKYIVIKLADIEKHLPDDQQLKLSALVTKIRIGRLKEGKTDQSYVCVAADWPMYEQVWSMVQTFVEGKPNEIDELRQQLASLRAQAITDACQYEEWTGEREELKKQLAAAQADNKAAWDTNRSIDKARQEDYKKRLEAQDRIAELEAQAVPEGLPAILEEAADIISGEKEMRFPIVDELHGFALMLNTAPSPEGE